MFCQKISNQSRVILGAAALHLRTVVPGAKFQGLSHFEWKCWNICNDDPNMQRGPRIPAASQRLWQSSGRSPTVPHLPDGAVKAQKRQRARQARIAAATSITEVLERKVEEVDRRTICSGAPASVTNEVVVWSVHRLSVWHFVTPPSTPRIT